MKGIFFFFNQDTNGLLQMKNISPEYEGSAGVSDYTGKSTTKKLMRDFTNTFFFGQILSWS